ncbi:MAG: hypothetical protein K7J15_04385 [Candidatus Regiella insecticola]|nr:hypothetical protein [Candidatus Regiella insecticola]
MKKILTIFPADQIYNNISNNNNNNNNNNNHRPLEKSSPTKLALK